MNKKYTKQEVESMRERLAEDEWGGLSDRDLRHVLWAGCYGWKNISDEDVIEQYEEHYD